MNLDDKSNRINALQVGEVTCVAYTYQSGPPYSKGNCFSVICDDKNHYRVLNFNYENLKSLLNNGLTMPIECIKLSERSVVFHDIRIDHKWYSDELCTICSPEHLLSLPQRLQRLRKIEDGTITIIKV